MDTLQPPFIDVEGAVADAGISIAELSESTGISKDTLARKLPDPGKFSVDEFAAIADRVPSLLESLRAA